MKPLKLWEIALLFAAGWLAFGGGIGVPGLTTKATAAVYVYEKDQTGSVPGPVLVALDKLNREKKILATTFEDDTTDNTGETPEQYKIPLAAARTAGLPALVVSAGAKVVRTVKDPKTEQAVLEAVP